VSLSALTIALLSVTAWSAMPAATAGDDRIRRLRQDGVVEFLQPSGSPAAAVVVEIAETPAEHARGLMGRRLEDERSGMLFVFEAPRTQVFWMRNTPSSLDIIFVDEALQVINVAQRTLPMSDHRYVSLAPARYVIEVIGGFCERNRVGSGSRIRWQRF
jgi:uncharacterized membrane protein (UPF0127 family)